jgi:hypothetical protein
MAFDRVILENPRTGQIRKAPVGFSWTMFFWGPFAPMFRGDWKWAIILLIVALIAAAASGGFLGWLPFFIAAFMWNKSYLNRLVSDGFQLKATERGSSLDKVDRALGYSAKRIAEPEHAQPI